VLYTGIHIRKSLKLGGLGRINLSKNGLSVSTGVKNFRTSINSNGTIRKTIGITRGIYYTDQHKIGRKTYKKIDKKEVPHMGNKENIVFVASAIAIIVLIGKTGLIGVSILGAIWYFKCFKKVKNINKEDK